MGLSYFQDQADSMLLLNNIIKYFTIPPEEGIRASLP